MVQVLSLTTVAGFLSKLKISAVIIDLSEAYNTIWRQDLIFKLIQVIPCLTTATLINTMLSSRKLQVCHEKSSYHPEEVEQWTATS